MHKIVFSKYLTGTPLEKTAPRLAACGFSGMEVTVRPGEAVEPSRASQELPALAHSLLKTGCGIDMICTRITSPDSPFAEEILRTAASLGIRRYRLGEWRYEGFGSIRKQRADVQAALKDLAEMNREIGVRGLIQNHSHRFFGAVPADLDWALGDIPPGEIGIYFDPVHAVIEGGSSGWLMGMDLIAPRIAALAVKDFFWRDDKQGRGGARRHSMQLCPLGTGNVPWPDIVDILKQIGFDGPASFYGGGSVSSEKTTSSLQDRIDGLERERQRFEALSG